MSECRNCSACEVRSLGFVGTVAPFFLKRVYGMETRSLGARNRLKVALRGLLKPVKPLFDRLYPVGAVVELESCRNCSFVQLKQGLPEEWINRLYADYRMDSYNKERIDYEPGYAKIAPYIGLPEEAKTRVEALTQWLGGKMEIHEHLTMLDFGGADGRFLPNLPAKKYVFEISDYPPAPGITRINCADDLKEYSFVQLAHVLEHVMHPLALAKTVSERIEPGGYLYLEVPQETEDEVLEGLKRGELAKTFTVHEHINSYSSAAVAALFEAVGLEMIAIEKQKIDYGYLEWTIVRALGRKTQDGMSKQD